MPAPFRCRSRPGPNRGGRRSRSAAGRRGREKPAANFGTGACPGFFMRPSQGYPPSPAAENPGKTGLFHRQFLPTNGIINLCLLPFLTEEAIYLK